MIWLNLFIFSLTVLVPISTIIWFFEGYPVLIGKSPFSLFFILFVFLGIIALGLTVFGIYAGIKLSNRHSNAIRIAKNFLLVGLGFKICAAFFLYLIASLGEDIESMGEGGRAMVAHIIYFVTWYSYLNKSKTVKKIWGIPKEASGTSSWKEFNSPIGRFRAIFPTCPVHKTENLRAPLMGVVKIVKHDSYISEATDGTLYTISTKPFPPEVVDVLHLHIETFLEETLNTMVASVKGTKLISTNLTYLGRDRALDYLVSIPFPNNTIKFCKGKIILVGQIEYELGVCYKSQNYNESDCNKFINSFVLY